MDKKTNKFNKNDIPFPDDLGEIDLLPDKLITEEESMEMFKWMMGMTPEPPEAVQRISSNMATKINIAMGYVIAMNIKRIDHLSKFMKESEDYLFDATQLINEDDKDTMIKYYEIAGSQMKSALEWTRKYVYQNKKELKEAGKRIDKLQSLLMTLPQETLESLIDSLEKGNVDSMIKDNADADPDVEDNDGDNLEDDD